MMLNNFFYSFKVDEWVENKKKAILQLRNVSEYFNKDIRKMLCDYITPSNQINIAIHGINGIKESKKCKVIKKSLCDKLPAEIIDNYFSSTWICKDKHINVCNLYPISNELLFVKKDDVPITIKDTTCDLYLIDESLTTKPIFLQSPKMYVESITKNHDTYLTIRCIYADFYSKETINFLSNIIVLNCCLWKIFDNFTFNGAILDVKFKKVARTHIDLIFIIDQCQQRRPKIYDKFKKQNCVSFDEISLRRKLKEGTIIQCILYADSILFEKSYFNDTHTYTLINNKISQCRILGNVTCDLFSKSNFLNFGYDIVEKYLDVGTDKNDWKLRKCDKDWNYITNNLINLTKCQESTSLINYFIQTPLMRIAFDIADDKYSRCILNLKFDDLENDDQKRFYDDLKKINDVIANFVSVNYEKSKYLPLIKCQDEKLYCPHFNVSRTRFLDISFIDDQNRSIDLEHIQKYLRMNVLCRAIFNFDNVCGGYNGNIYVKPILHQLQLFPESSDEEMTNLLFCEDEDEY